MWLFLVKEKYSTILRAHSQLSVTNHSWKNSICKSNNQQSTTCFQCHKSTDDMRKGKETLPKKQRNAKYDEYHYNTHHFKYFCVDLCF